ncbi:MAG: Holliday junction resolvase RuvX [Ruminococcus sp.]|nr:Holliday junction resolvase RuvX [Ruminococcus sp.]
MIIMAIDFGETRTGIAVCDKWENMASPVRIINERNDEQRLIKTAAAAKEFQAELLLVGYPKNMNNTVGEKAKRCQDFAEKLHERTGISVKLWDERCTTISAHICMNDTNTRGKKRKEKLDAVAAAILLESYLGYRKNQLTK